MAPLSERQQQAQAIASELAKLGAWVTSALPLGYNAQLRFQVLDSDREAVLSKVAGWGWSPVLLGGVPRFTPAGALPSTIYQFDLPHERQPVHADRTIKDEVVSEKAHAEIKAFKKLKLS
jgi:hypothetical protein